MAHAHSQDMQRSGLFNKALWCVGLGLLANAGVLLYSTTRPGLSQAAFAQDAPVNRMVGAAGTYMMPGQLGPDAWGVYLLDVDTQTISVYKTDPRQSRFKLMAVRSYRHDRYLQDFNNDSPTPKEVQKLIEQQRERERLEGKNVPNDVPADAPQ